MFWGIRLTGRSLPWRAVELLLPSPFCWHGWGRAAGILAAGHALGAQSLWFCESGLHLLCLNSFALSGSPDNNKHLSCLVGRALLAHAGERPGIDVWMASILGVVGVALIKQPWSRGDLAIDWLPLLAAFMAAWSTALAMLGLNRLGHIDTRAVVAHFSGVGILFALVAMLLFPREHLETSVTAGSVPWLLAGVGLTATAGQLCLTRAFTTGKASRVAVVGLSQVLFAVAIDWIFFQKPVNALAMLGMVLVVVPTAHVIMQRDRKRVA